MWIGFSKLFLAKTDKIVLNDCVNLKQRTLHIFLKYPEYVQRGLFKNLNENTNFYNFWKVNIIS